MTFPTTISESFAKTEAIEVASSGSEVPKATIVTPIINGEIPNERPIFSAESIKKSEDLSRTARLTKNIIIYKPTSSILSLLNDLYKMKFFKVDTK